MNNGDSVRSLLASACTDADIERRHEAEILLGHALGRDRAWLFTHPDAVPDAEAAARFMDLLERRVRGEPVAYLIGRRGFWTLDLEVAPGILIPRPETELLVELALARLETNRALRVADLGTGSGAIALAIASERPQVRVLACDVSPIAVGITRRNAERNEMHNVEVLQSDWYAGLAGQCFDLIVSNPPYIADGDVHLEQGDLRFEPRSALASGPDGLDALRTLIADARQHLSAEGWLLLEHGYDQGPAVRDLLHAAGFTAIQTWPDLAGHDRVSGGRQPTQSA